MVLFRHKVHLPGSTVNAQFNKVNAVTWMKRNNIADTSQFMAVLNIADAEGNNLGNLLTWHWRSDKKIRNSFMLNVKAPLA